MDGCRCRCRCRYRYRHVSHTLTQAGVSRFTARPRRAGGHVCVCVGHRSVARVAAGATWAHRTTSAPWANRSGYATVVDAAGAIFVIGGLADDGHTRTYYNDVWKLTDGSADRTRAGVLEGVLTGYLR